MAERKANENDGRGRRWRVALWGGAAALLLLPLAAMQVTDEVAWNAADFAFAAVLLGGVGLAFELVARRPGSGAYRAGVATAVTAAVLMVWANGAVGLIGSEDNSANLVFLGVLAVGLAGAVIARLRPLGMARALAATAGAQGLAGLAVGLGLWGPVPMGDVVAATGVFAALWLLSAGLFRRAARAEADAV